MTKKYATVITLLLVFTLQAQTYEFSISFLGVNSSTNNYQMALIATPNESVVNERCDDMGAGFYVPVGVTLGNFEMGNSGLPASEWTSTSLSDTSSAYFLGRVEAGASSVFLNGSGPFELVLFDIIADPNPTTGEIIFVENGDPVFNELLFIQNYINIAALDKYAQNSPTANSVQFTTLSVTDLNNGLSGISIFPNPVNDVLNIKLNTPSSEIDNIKIFSIEGRLIQQHNSISLSENNLIKLDTSELNQALYFVTITSTENELATFKMLVN